VQWKLAWIMVGWMSWSGSAHAAKFANQFVEFEMPPQWQCALEGAEWVCQNSDPSKKRDAIIILAAKLKGDQDSLDQYLGYLKKPKSYTSIKGKPVKSEMKYAKIARYQDQTWVDSLHLESEWPSYYTRYLGTIKKDIAVLVTYSIHKGKYQSYLKDFEALVNTLRVFRRAGGINAQPANKKMFVEVPSQVTAGNLFGDVGLQGDDEGAVGNTQAKKKDDLLFYLVLGGLLIGFIIWRRRRG